MKNKFQFGGIYNPEDTSVVENNGDACINDREYPFIKDCSEVILTRKEINEINNIINKEPTEFVNLILKKKSKLQYYMRFKFALRILYKKTRNYL